MDFSVEFSVVYSLYGIRYTGNRGAGPGAARVHVRLVTERAGAPAPRAARGGPVRAAAGAPAHRTSHSNVPRKNEIKRSA